MAGSPTMQRMVGSAPMTRLFVLLLGCLGLAAQGLDSHFHHLHLNAVDPAAAIAFYPAKFEAEKAKFDGTRDAVWAQKSWLLFDKVAAPPPHEIVSSIWHFGWGAVDMPAHYQQQVDKGTKFSWPITELFPKFFYAYVEGPDKAIIEINTAAGHHFGHLHLISADPIKAGQWYIDHFGAKWRSGRPPSPEPRFIRGFQTGPSASLMMDNVNIIIFPVEYARQQWPEQWKDRTEFLTPRGRVVDHVAFSVASLSEAAARFPNLTKPARISGTKVQSAFIEGPDKIAIEIVEGHSEKK
jgi:hypothetical protein